VLNSGHETTQFPFKGGIAAFATRHRLEHNTIQYAPDGVSFKVAATTSLMPTAAGPYAPDAFTDTRDGWGITWGLCHFTNAGTRQTRHSILARFECDLSRDVNEPLMKQTELFLDPKVYFSRGLSPKGEPQGRTGRDHKQARARGLGTGHGRGRRRIGYHHQDRLLLQEAAPVRRTGRRSCSGISQGPQPGGQDAVRALAESARVDRRSSKKGGAAAPRGFGRQVLFAPVLF